MARFHVAPLSTDTSTLTTDPPPASLAVPVMLTVLVFYLVILVTMVYGPIAAYLVESFPARTRYTSLSLPYHLGNGGRKLWQQISKTHEVDHQS